jgi:hypothetical protein
MSFVGLSLKYPTLKIIFDLPIFVEYQYPYAMSQIPFGAAPFLNNVDSSKSSF